MTPEDFKRLFPHASPSTIARNLSALSSGLRSGDAQRIKGGSLVTDDLRKAPGWSGTARRFEIIFRVYAVMPADWDNYSIKQLQDWLVRAGILPGDGWKNLSGRVITAKADAPHEERTEIEIRAME